MMNSMQQPLGPVNFSEEELRKLAMLLQSIPDGEGLASINQGEAELMKSYGGSGTPLPGTQGLGPGGEPVRSYDKEVDVNLSGDTSTGTQGTGYGTGTSTGQENLQSNQGDGGNSGGGGAGFVYNLSGKRVYDSYGLGGDHPSLNPGYDYGANANTTVTTTKDDTIIPPKKDPSQTGIVEGETGDEYGDGGEGLDQRPDQGLLEDRPDVIQGRDTIAGQSGDWNKHLEQGGTTWDGKGDQPVKSHGFQPGSTSDTGGTTTATTTTTTAEPTKYKDKNGNEYDSQAEANAANVKIDAITTRIENTPLTTDKTFKLWLIENKDTYPIPPSSEAQLEAAFGVAKIKSNDAAAVMLPKMVDSMNLMLKADGSAVPFDTWWATIGPPKPANLSEATMRIMYAKAVFKAERQEAFTLTTEELESWMRPPVVLAIEGNFEEWWEGKKGQFKESKTFDDREFAEKAHAAAIVGDAKAVTVGDVDPVTGDVIDMTATAPVMATEGNFKEWWEGKGGPEGLFPTREEALLAHEAAIEGAAPVTVGDVDPVTGDVTGTGDVTAPTVEFGDAITEDTVNAIQAVTDADMDAIFAGGVGEDVTGIDAAEKLLVARVEGTAVSPAEVQLKRSVENNLRMLLGVTVGADADPAKVRQLKNIWVDMTQEVTGKAAEIRSAESMAAEKELVALYQGKSTMKLQVRLANLEVQKQTAFKNADIALASKLANQATRLTEVITQANIDRDISLADLKSRTDKMIAQGTMDLATALANLQAKKDLAIEQGKLDVALSIANLQKNILLAQVNVEVAVKQRSLDDALAIIAYKGQMALMGLEVQIDTVELQADLQEMGFELQQNLAELSTNAQIQIAEIEAKWRRAQAKGQETASYVSAMGTLLTGLAVEWIKTSDIRAKTNISPGSGEVESFLDALNAYTYEYKDPDAPGSDAGMFAGVMAQDLEKTPMGASFVQDTPRGKQVDYGHGLAAILASQANIHDRLKHLEEG